MKRYLSLMFTCICCIAVFAIATTVVSAKQEKVCLCHKGHTICIAAPAVPAHLHHGDSLGACPVVCGGSAGDTCSATQFCKLAEGVCDASASGVCANLPAPCPTTVTPVCGCDGHTYNNACEANAAGVNVASQGACPSGACGGAAGVTCAVGEFCKLETGACSADAEGVCTVIPGACPSSFIPVCGCDGQTYSNECFAASNGASVAATGVCPQGAACVVGGGTCAAGEFCRPAVGDCAASAEGHCTTIPEVCPPAISNIPVCGCDGETYVNPCAAFAAGVGIAAAGECEADQQACGGTGGGTCPEGEFCKRPLGECATDAEGVCQSKPDTCDGTAAPVCGCDGVTYTNACVADGAGVTVASEGECGELVACDGVTGVNCPQGQFCKHADGACAADVQGVCTETPLTCEPVDSPVCSCIGVGFPNACFANAVGLNIENTGACAPPAEPVACDGTTGVTCAVGQFCKHADGACGAEVEGVCTATPLTCEPVDSPVCSCIGVGFPNACFANAVGLNIENTGACTP